MALASSALLAAAIAGASCSPGYDLGTGAGPSTGGAGGATTTASGSTSSRSSTGAGGRGSGGSTGTGGSGGGEPAGPSALTVVNGLNDYPALRFCFLPNETPWPAATSGLPYGAAQVVDLATALPSAGDVATWIVAGDLASSAGMTCSQILAAAQSGGLVDAGSDASDGSDQAGTDAGSGAGGGGAGGSGSGDAGILDAATDGATPDASGDAGTEDAGVEDAGTDAGADAGGDGGDAGSAPPFVVAQLGTIPQSILAAGRSLLLVPTGCLGGPTHQGPTAVSGCGTGYTEANPTVGVVLVAMSRIVDKTSLSLQFVNASAALPPSDMRLLPAVDNPTPIVVAPDLGEGAIAPDPPYHGTMVGALGTLGMVQLQTVSPGGAQPSSTLALSTVLASSSIGLSKVVDGASLVFVAIGGAPGVQAGPFWHPFGYATVLANP